MTTVYYEVDGVPVPAKECCWTLIAPCGCECAWATARYCASEEQAWTDFSRSKAVRRRDEKLGYRVEIKRHKDIRVEEDCSHVPRFGVEPRPEMDGHTWAAMKGGRVLHLVPLEIGDYDTAYADARTPAICGRNDAFLWSTRNVDLLECTHCLKAATERVGGAA
ncbi:hypothetical protein [Nocardia wallacei]|uniref:hypothetical protein n=1 Tax=Nocardia wallacei TaxID=480035 RepID=UPI002458CAE9|nr:hypothetical protein [Nocardia wallacei]